MPRLNLEPTHKPIRDYYATLQQYDQHNATHEGAVSNPFAFLLDACAKQLNATLIPQYGRHTPKGNWLVIDGVVLDEYGLPFAYWEAKDIDDNLVKAVQAKRDAGYPLIDPFVSTPTTKTAQTAKRTSPIGHCPNSVRTITMILLPNGTSSTIPTPSCTILRAAVYCGFNWARYHCQPEDSKDC